MRTKKMNDETITVTQWLAGARFDKSAAYVKNDRGGYTLRDDLMKKTEAEAKYRWEHGGKEIHDKLQTIPNFDETQEYQDYMTWARGYLN